MASTPGAPLLSPGWSPWPTTSWAASPAPALQIRRVCGWRPVQGWGTKVRRVGGVRGACGSSPPGCGHPRITSHARLGIRVMAVTPSPLQVIVPPHTHTTKQVAFSWTLTLNAVMAPLFTLTTQRARSASWHACGSSCGQVRGWPSGGGGGAARLARLQRHNPVISHQQ